MAAVLSEVNVFPCGRYKWGLNRHTGKAGMDSDSCVIVLNQGRSLVKSVIGSANIW